MKNGANVLSGAGLSVSL